MNYPASLFRALSSAWQFDAASAQVDTFAAELTAQVAERQHAVCLGLIRKEAVAKFYGLVYLLDGYGLTLRKRHRKGGDGVFVYAELRGPLPSEFVGATVLEHRLEPELTFAEAA